MKKNDTTNIGNFRLVSLCFCSYNFKGCTLNFLFILKCILTNLDLVVVYSLRYYFRNVLNGLKHFMTKLNHWLNPKTLKYISAINL